LSENGVADTVGKNARQLKDLCAQHGIPTVKTVSNSLERNRSELELELRGVVTKGKNKREFVQLCEHHQIAIVKTVGKIKEGWEGKAKGLLQVLWERGLLDASELKRYSLTGKKDDLGTVDNSTRLRHIMGMCDDFINEEGML
jgi:isochorismate hydrolase